MKRQISKAKQESEGGNGRLLSFFAIWLFLMMTPLARAGLDWSELPSLPNPHDFAGAFAGTSNGVLIVAGGANFPCALPWNGGLKIWNDRIFMLETSESNWREVGRLPCPLDFL